MKKIVNRVADLPKAFCLENYEAIKDFKIQDWVGNLDMRSLRRSMFAMGEYYKSELVKSADYILGKPVFQLGVDYATGVGLSKMVYRRQVRDQSVLDALSGHEWFDGERLKKWTDAYLDLYKTRAPDDDSDKELYKSIHEKSMWSAFMEEGISDSGEVNVTVNLHASEAQLVDDFRQWLTEIKEARSLAHQRKRLNQMDFEDWDRFKVLAYLDLTFWALVNDYEITNQVLGLALFPSEFEIALADRVRKVVSPLAHKLVTEDFCDLLRAQALEMIEVERESPNSIPAKWATVLVTDDGTIRFTPDQ